jgi:dihydropteroate synthase
MFIPEEITFPTTLIGDHKFVWGERTFVMGVVNVTPDSFSGDGALRSTSEAQAAVSQALRMEDEGADIIDIGGESTRPASVYPDAVPVEGNDEIARVVPVIEGLADRLGIPISIDTRKAVVAEAAVRAGAVLVNDVSTLGDEGMSGVIARTGVPIVVSHIRQGGHKSEVVQGVLNDLGAAVDRLVMAGVDRTNIVVDPGIGFDKNAGQSLELMKYIGMLRSDIELPVLVGSSRKSFVGTVTGESVEDRRFGTAATVALSIQGGADIVRVHDVKEMVRVAKMSDAIVRGSGQSRYG